MREAVIVDAVRTPVGRYGGALKDVRSDDLAALCICGARQAQQLDRTRIEDVIMGCTNQAGEDNRNVARMALLLAGLPLGRRADDQPPVRLRIERGGGGRARDPRMARATSSSRAGPSR